MCCYLAEDCLSSCNSHYYSNLMQALCICSHLWLLPSWKKKKFTILVVIKIKRGKSAQKLLNKTIKQTFPFKIPESWSCSSGCSLFSGRNVSSVIHVTSLVWRHRISHHPGFSYLDYWGRIKTSWHQAAHQEWAKHQFPDPSCQVLRSQLNGG